MTDYEDHDWGNDGPDDGPTERVYDDGSCVDIDAPLRPGWNLSWWEVGPDYDDEGLVDGVCDYVETINVTPAFVSSRRLPAPPKSPLVRTRRRVGIRRLAVRARRSRRSRASPARPSDPDRPPPRHVIAELGGLS